MTAMLSALIGCLAAQLLIAVLRARWRRRAARPWQRMQHAQGRSRHRLHQ